MTHYPDHEKRIREALCLADQDEELITVVASRHLRALLADLDAARAALSEAKAGWWVAVPVEPTPEMITAALRECGGIGGGSCGEHTGVDGSDLAWVWDVMLTARPLPAPPAQKEPT